MIMRHLIYILFFTLVFSCKPQNKIIESTNNDLLIQKENGLTPIESNIVNDFLDFELKKDRYKNYKEYKYVIIEEALKKNKSLSAYELNYNNKNSWGSDIKFWVVDSVQINKIKKDIESEKVYHWKIKDFKNIKASTLKSEELRKMINSGMLFYDANRLVIYLSRPLVIDDNNALLSFEIDNCRYLCNSITHFTVLLKKENNKWIENSFYDDGIMY